MSDALEPLRGRRALVVGASGFVGRHVVRALVDVGANVVATGRSAVRVDAALGDATARAVEIRPADLGDPDATEALLRDVRPAVTFNLAGYGVGRDERDEDTAVRVNVALPMSLTMYVESHRDPDWPGLALVHAGSALEYGEVSGDLSEDGPRNPTTLYGRTKLDATLQLEAACRKFGAMGRPLRAVTARLFMLYGPGERPGRLLPTLLEAARTGAEVPLSAGTQRRDFTYVGEAAEGLLRLAVSPLAGPGAGPDAGPPPGAVCNLATGRLTSIRAFAEAAAGVLGIKEERLAFGALPTRAEEMEHEPVNTERLEAWTAWRPTISPAEGVRRTLELSPPPSPS